MTAAESAHAGSNRSGLNLCRGLGISGGQGAALALCQPVGGEEQIGGIAFCCALIEGAAGGIGNGKGAVRRRQTAPLTHAAGAAEEQAGLGRLEVQPHAGTAAGCQNRTAGDGNGAVGIQRLVVRRAGSPYADNAAGDSQVPVRVEAVAAGGIGIDLTADDVYGEGHVLQVRIGSVDAVIRRPDRDITGVDIDTGPLQPLVTGLDINGRPFLAFGSNVQRQVTVDGIVPGVDGQAAAGNVQQGFRVDGIVDGSVNSQCQVLDRQAGLPVLGIRTGLNAVFPLGGNGQAAGTAEDDLGAVLALDDGVLRVLIVRVIFIVVLLPVRQGAGAVYLNGDLGALVAGNGSPVRSGKGQILQHQGYPGGALLHGDAAVGAAAGKHIGTGLGNRHMGAVDLHPGSGAADGGIGEGQFHRICRGDGSGRLGNLLCLSRLGKDGRCPVRRGAAGEADHRQAQNQGQGFLI